MQDLVEYSQVLANLATFLGFPIAVLVFAFALKAQRQDREFGTYDSLDDKYFDYLRVCVESPHLNLYYYPITQRPLDEEEKIAQWALFEMLVSMMERAFLMHSGQRQKMRREQWEGWDAYCEYWSRDPRFQGLWRYLGDQFDASFTRYMNAKIADAA